MPLTQRQIAEESWRQVPGYPAYEVSNHGNVRSYWRREGTIGKRGTRVVIGTISSPVKAAIVGTGTGRLAVTLGNGAGGQKSFGVAHLVLLVFVRPPADNEVARHRHDPTPTNCRLENLEWGTYRDNAKDIITHKGKYHNAKLWPKDVEAILLKIASGVMQKDIATEYGVSPSLITMIKQGKAQTLLLDHSDAARRPALRTVGGGF